MLVWPDLTNPWISTGSPLDLCSISTGSLLNLQWISTAFPLGVRRISTASSLDLLCISTGSLLNLHCIFNSYPLNLHWISNSSKLDLHCIFIGSPLDLCWIFTDLHQISRKLILIRLSVWDTESCVLQLQTVGKIKPPCLVKHLYYSSGSTVVFWPPAQVQVPPQNWARACQSVLTMLLWCLSGSSALFSHQASKTHHFFSPALLSCSVILDFDVNAPRWSALNS